MTSDPFIKVANDFKSVCRKQPLCVKQPDGLAIEAVFQSFCPSFDAPVLTSPNHVPMNQSYIVSTEAVCPSRKSTVCSLTCTNINNLSMSTSAKLPSKAIKEKC